MNQINTSQTNITPHSGSVPKPTQNTNPETPKDSVLICAGKDLQENSDLTKMKTLSKTAQPSVKTLGEAVEEIEAEKKNELSVAEKTANLIQQTIGGIKAFPSFIYPSVINASPEEFQFTYDVLDQLPLKDVATFQQVNWKPELHMFLDKTKAASGMATPTGFTSLMDLSRDQCGKLNDWAKEVIIHETGHMRDFSEGFFDLVSQQSAKDAMWGQGPHISEYAKTNRWEDFAESYAAYYMEPEKLLAECPEKYEKIAELEKLGLTDQLLETDAFRETGKFIGQKLSAIPYLQVGVSAASYGLNIFNMIQGGRKLKEGNKTGDETKQMEGTMEIASGALYATKVLALGGLAVDGAKQALSQAVREGEITPGEANYVAQHTVGAPATALKAAKNWIKDKFSKNKETQTSEDNAKTQSEEKAALAEKEQSKPVKAKDAVKAFSIGTGGAAGSVAGSLLGIYGGVTAGFAAAGPIGGAIGMVLGSAIGVTAMNQAGAHLGTAVGEALQNKWNDSATGSTEKSYVHTLTENAEKLYEHSTGYTGIQIEYNLK